MTIFKGITSDEIISVVNNLNTSIIKKTDDIKQKAPNFNTVVSTSSISYETYQGVPGKFRIKVIYKWIILKLTLESTKINLKKFKNSHKKYEITIQKQKF